MLIILNPFYAEKNRKKTFIGHGMTWHRHTHRRSAHTSRDTHTHIFFHVSVVFVCDVHAFLRGNMFHFWLAVQASSNFRQRVCTSCLLSGFVLLQICLVEACRAQRRQWTAVLDHARSWWRFRTQLRSWSSGTSSWKPRYLHLPPSTMYNYIILYTLISISIYGNRSKGPFKEF